MLGLNQQGGYKTLVPDNDQYTEHSCIKYNSFA